MYLKSEFIEKRIIIFKHSWINSISKIKRTMKEYFLNKYLNFLKIEKKKVLFIYLFCDHIPYIYEREKIVCYDSDLRDVAANGATPS